MYTGLIDKIGYLKNRTFNGNILKITVDVDGLWIDLELGESISVNGVCLTVTDFSNKSFSADISEITVQDTTFKSLKINSKLNLERCMKIGDRLGGHIVQGHVDGLGKVVSKVNRNGNMFLKIKPEKSVHNMIINKASVAVDGVSLTVQEVESNSFTLLIIPHSAKHTNLLERRVGDLVNLETDVLAKYIKHFTSEDRTKNIFNSFQ